jgi:hypothetical protein
MARLAWLLLLFSVATASAAEARSAVCIEDAADLAEPARAAFQKEFLRMLTPLSVAPYWSEADSCASPGIRVRILPSSSDAPADALGRARVVDGRISGDIQVVLAPVLGCDCVQGWEGVGRALARIAAHELNHHLRQQAGHHREGLMRAAISVRELAASDASSIRWPASR